MSPRDVQAQPRRARRATRRRLGSARVDDDGRRRRLRLAALGLLDFFAFRVHVLARGGAALPGDGAVSRRRRSAADAALLVFQVLGWALKLVLPFGDGSAASVAGVERCGALGVSAERLAQNTKLAAASNELETLDASSSPLQSQRTGRGSADCSRPRFMLQIGHSFKHLCLCGGSAIIVHTSSPRRRGERTGGIAPPRIDL